MNVDFINIHLYAIDIFPVFEDDNAIPRLLKAADVCEAKGKKIVIGETWLYKRLKNDPQDPEIIYGRDYFDFFEDLDSRFIGLLSKIANYKKMEYISFFWSSFFFSYLAYHDEKGLDTAKKKSMNNRTVTQNVINGVYSKTGINFRNVFMK